MKNFKSIIRNLIADESGQGTAEYILLVVVVIALITLFKAPILAAVQAKMGEVTQLIGGFKGTP